LISSSPGNPKLSNPHCAPVVKIFRKNREFKMNNMSIAKVAASSLILGSTLLGFGPAGDFVGSLASASASAPQADAIKFAKRARAASAKGDIDQAVIFSERAVALSPNNAEYRLMLGDAYLSSGRFTSAETAFDDALSLSPGQPRVALKLALAKIALGKVDAARSLLEEHREKLSAADYGLATALSGDLESAVTVLEASVRGSGDALSRQNLALVYALSGRWAEARTTAAQDLSPDLIDQRMTQWAMMARPKASWDQVASVLSVQPAYDAGQPVGLALNKSSFQSQFAAASPAASLTAPVEIESAEQSAVFEAPLADNPVASAPVQVASAAPAKPVASGSAISFAPRQEIVQAIRQVANAEAPLVRSQAKPMKTAIAAPRRQKPVVIETVAAPRPFAQPKQAQRVVAPQSGREFKSGQFAVQLGAYGSKAQAEAAWAKASRKNSTLAGHKPMTATVLSNGKSLKRLAAAGFGSRESAQAACNDVKANGGECFVRSFAGVELAQWVGLNAASGPKLAGKLAAPAKPIKIAARKAAPAPAKPVKVSAMAPVKPVKIAAR
jgi:D-alanyl-D-alanine carboxypeptidase